MPTATLLADRAALESHWSIWLAGLFGGYLGAPMAGHHCDFWDWVWSVETAIRPQPFFAIWSRGHAKSTSMEMACVALAARGRRRYGLYCCETQDQADDHVSNVASMLESPAINAFYPDLASRAVGKYGNSKGWRRNRLRTASGFTLDAIGLDTAARGAKVDEDRPGLLVLDDLDGELDSLGVTERKIKTLTRKIIPAGSDDLAVMGGQNLVHAGSVFARVADGRADFLADRIVSGPVPAVAGLTTELVEGRCRLIAGRSTWSGMSLERCQEMIDDMGITAFRAECQQDLTAPPGGIFDHMSFAHCAANEVPDLVRIVVWVDPAVTNTDASDSHGIQADGISSAGVIYRLWSWEARTTPEDSLRRAIRKGLELGAEAVGVETDQGGDTWESVYRAAAQAVQLERQGAALPAARLPRFRSAKAGQGYGPKTHRASQMLADYERAGRIVHVLGTHDVLEAALGRFPRTKPLDLCDVAFWAWADLRGLLRSKVRLIA